MPAPHNLCLWGCVHTYMCVVACVVESACVLSPFHAYVKQNPPLNLFVSRDRKTGPFSSHLNKSTLHYTSLNKVGKRWFNPTINLDGIATLVSFPGSSPAWIELGIEASAAVIVPGIYNSSCSKDKIFNLWNKESLWEHKSCYSHEWGSHINSFYTTPIAVLVP